MLSMMWLIGAVLVSLWCCHKHREAEKNGSFHTGSWFLGAMVVLTVALGITKDTAVKPVYQWLLWALPEQGTSLNLITANFLTGIACLIFAAGIPMAYSMVLIAYDEKMKARKSISEQR